MSIKENGQPEGQDECYRALPTLVIIYVSAAIFVWFDSLQPVNNFQSCLDGSSCVEPVLSSG